MASGEVRRFSFRVREAFVLTGRGTTVVGFIEDGSIQEGDVLGVAGRPGRTFTCSGASALRETGWTPGTPVPVGLLLQDASPTDFSPGDRLVNVR